MKVLFVILLFIQIYIFILYPVLIAIIAWLKKCNKPETRKSYNLNVTIVVAARNEEKVIESKILNSLEINYPKEHLEIFIVSDNSSDRTDEIVRKYKDNGITLISLDCRHGKTALQNIAVKKAKGEIIVFSDANAMYNPDSIQYIVSQFNDPDVGCVSGELCYANPGKSAAGREENLYWKYEKYLKRKEDCISTIMGANGSIYAVRKSDYVPLGDDIISDFIEPLEIASKGKKVVYEDKALSYEESSVTFEEELMRKRRILSRSIYSLYIHRHLLNPFKNPQLAFGLFSHKILRWLSPVFLIILLAVNLFILDSFFYRLVFILQMIFYSLSLIVVLIRHNKKMPTFILVPYYFCLLGYASLLGIFDFIKGRNRAIWEPVRN